MINCAFPDQALIAAAFFDWGNRMILQRSNSFLWVILFYVAGELIFPGSATARPQENPTGIPNGNFESWSENQANSWAFISADGGQLRVADSTRPSSPFAALMDATQDSIRASSFTNLMQSLPAEPWRGKKVRLRAHIKTAQLAGAAAAQMWLRVDVKPAASGESKTSAQAGAFDNMDGRPIRSTEYEAFEIVLPVAESASQLALGVFLNGKGQVWVDDMTLEIVPDDTPVTSTQEVSATPRMQLPPLVLKAFQEAEQAPQQPFLTHWLWWPLSALLVFCVAMLGPVTSARDQDVRAHDVEVKTGRLWWKVQGFAIRVAVVYWLLNGLPAMVGSLATGPLSFAAPLVSWLEQGNSALAHWLAATWFGIDGELVPPNGSGDTTYNYLLVLGHFLVSLAVGTLWTVVDRRVSDHAILRDLLRTWLRYTIAFAMIGYGLAKFTFEGNQFASNSSFQLDKTWGESSPMNVLWAFMGASQAYTMFAGLGEVLAGLLIVWRRTTLLGAFVALGVMTNVMMMNFCYDVPVKLYSTHLAVMSIMVLLPDARRLANLFLLNRSIEPASLVGAWHSRWAWWMRLVLKSLVVGGLVLLPVGTQAVSLPQQYEKFAAANSPDKLQAYPLTKRGFRWINEVPFNR